MVELIEDPTREQGFEGMILGTPDMSFKYDIEPFDLHAAARYVREHNLSGIDDKIKKMFAIKSNEQ